MESKQIASPVVCEVAYNEASLGQLERDLSGNREGELVFQYPTVYIVHAESKNELTAYVGETTDIRRRTAQHLDADSEHREDWKTLKKQQNAQMIVIGHEHFNKSLTLDIEDRLMLYLTGSRGVQHLNNRRTNPQGKYYPSDERNVIFSKIWRKLHQLNKTAFPVEEVIKDSALFKASPFHELTPEQQDARQLILERVATALQNQTVGQLILVEGEAGSGKTVLLSSMFYEMMQTLNSQGRPIVSEDETHLDAALLVNHDEQLKVYEQIMYKLEVASKKTDSVTKPTHFILQHTPEKPVDVVLVDEAHLLWTQGKQTYRGSNQLLDLLRRARVVIAVFDRNQIIATNGYWEHQLLDELERKARAQGNLVQLKHQLRVQAGPEVESWLDALIHKHQVLPIPQQDKRGYEIRVFDDPAEMQTAIKQKAKNQESGLSRMLATFDWPFVQNKRDKDGDYWNVRVGNWSMPWNKQLPLIGAKWRSHSAQLAWAEIPETIAEVGSTFTIQGFDLNYAGVIIGPSVKLRNGRIVFDAKFSCNPRAKNKRTLQDGRAADVSQELLQNELNVLLTRGVHGLYLYAVDAELQAALLKAQGTLSTLDMVAEQYADYGETESD